MEKNSKKFKGKQWLRFRHVYALMMLVVTGILVYHVVNLLVLTPRRDAGIPIHGHRMEEIEYLEAAWMTETEAFGATVDDVDYVSIFWNNGPVVYVSVRVEEGTTRRRARRAAREVIEYFIEVSEDVVLQYDIQVVVSYGDVVEQREENHAAVIQHVHEYHHDLVEDILAWAETYPSEFNVDRAHNNIHNVFTESIRIAVGEEGLEEMKTRLASIDIVDEDEEEPLPRFPFNIRQIPPSNIARFPNWGTWNNRRARIDWNP